MSKVKTFELSGLDLFFNSNDHLPPHFHIRKPGKWEIRVLFLLCSQEKGLVFTIKWSAKTQPSSKEQREILAQVLKNRSTLLREWQNKVCIKETP